MHYVINVLVLLKTNKGQKHKGGEILKEKTVFEKMIKDAAVTFLPSVRQQKKKKQRESQSSDFIQMSLSARRGVFEYHNPICRSPAVNEGTNKQPHRALNLWITSGVDSSIIQ